MVVIDLLGYEKISVVEPVSMKWYRYVYVLSRLVQILRNGTANHCIERKTTPMVMIESGLTKWYDQPLLEMKTSRFHTVASGSIEWYGQPLCARENNTFSHNRIRFYQMVRSTTVWKGDNRIRFEEMVRSATVREGKSTGIGGAMQFVPEGDQRLHASNPEDLLSKCRVHRGR